MKKRKDGRFLKVVTLNGEKVYFYSSESTERKAERDIARQMMEYQEKQEEKDNISFATLADMWETEYRQNSPEVQYKKSIKSQYERIIDFFGEYKAKEITPKNVDDFLRSLKFSQKTVAAHRCKLNMIYNYGILHGYVDYNPVTVVKLPRGLKKGKRELPSTEELKIVSSHSNGFDLLPFFLLKTGCRKSEALAIKREDIDFKNKIIKIRSHVIHDSNKPIYESVLKSDAASREIILLDSLAKALPKNFKGFLFSMNGDGKEPLTKRAFDLKWKNYCERYGVDITAHQLRHGYATMLFEAGIDIKDTQELMGHSDISLTRTVYTHIRDAHRADTAKKLNKFKF